MEAVATIDSLCMKSTKYFSVRRKIVTIISFAFVLLFVYAATSKLIEFQKFQIQLSQSPMLTAFATWVAIFIPVVEFLIALLLCINRLQLLGLYASLSLMTMFVSYVLAITHFSEYIPCSCGGILQNMNWQQHLVFNIVFVCAAIVAILLMPHSKIFLARKTGDAENLQNRVG